MVRFGYLAEEEAELAGRAGSDADMLGNVIKSESDEVETIYIVSSRELAVAVGDQAAAGRFAKVRGGKVRGDETGHYDAKPH